MDHTSEASSTMAMPRPAWPGCFTAVAVGWAASRYMPSIPAPSPSATHLVGRGEIPLSQPSTARNMGTVATSSAVMPLGRYNTPNVVPPLPNPSRQTPIMAANPHPCSVGRGSPFRRMNR